MPFSLKEQDSDDGSLSQVPWLIKTFWPVKMSACVKSHVLDEEEFGQRPVVGFMLMSFK